MTDDDDDLALEHWSELERPKCIRCRASPAPYGRTRCEPCQAVIDSEWELFGRVLSTTELGIVQSGPDGEVPSCKCNDVR